MRTKHVRSIWIALATVGVILVADGRAAAQQQLFKLLAWDGAPSDTLGWSVAAFGDRTVVGAHNDNVLGVNSGSAYLFDVMTGQQLLKLVPLDGASYDNFGFSVSIHGDRVLVGAYRDDDVVVDSGSAYLFDADSGLQLFKLLASDGASGDDFGGAVSIHEDRAVVGAWRDDDHGPKTGSAYVFDVTTGQQLFKLTADDGDAYDLFGEHVAVGEDRIFITARGDDDQGDSSGSVYVYDVDTGLKLTELHAADGATMRNFGSGVAVSGALAIVGAGWDFDNGGSGSAYVIDHTSGQQLFKLFPSDGEFGDFFGGHVSIMGRRAVVGASGCDDFGLYSGAAYVFDVTSGEQLAKLLAEDGVAHHSFGHGVALYGNRTVVGALGDGEQATDAGAAYVFEIPAEPGHGYCFGDPLSGTPCPCGNNNDRSVPGSGCDNGVFSSGARLSGVGVASVSYDTLTLITTHQEPSNFGLYFQADNLLIDGLVWGDGLRCAGGTVIRLETRTADAAGSSSTTLSIAARGQVAAGDVRCYQLWYRTTVAPPCGPGAGEFNTTNGYAIQWLP